MGVGELREEHCFEMAANGEVPGPGLLARIPRVLADEPQGNEVERFLKDGTLGSGWRVFILTSLPSGRGSKDTSPSFDLNRVPDVGWLSIGFCYSIHRLSDW